MLGDIGSRLADATGSNNVDNLVRCTDPFRCNRRSGPQEELPGAAGNGETRSVERTGHWRSKKRAGLDPENVILGQFRGNRNEPGVATDSLVETFAALRLGIDNCRWDGVPFYIRAGKSRSVNCSEVLFELKAMPCASFGETAERPN